MKVAVVSFYYYQNDYWCNYDNVESYCDKHGYDLHYNIKQVDSENIHTPTYDGILYMRELLEKGYDYVFWIDGSDIIIVNDEMKLEDMIGEKPIQFSNDVITKTPLTIWESNTGLWGVKNHIDSKRYLDEVISSYDPSYEGAWSDIYYHDQNAMIDIGSNYLEFIDFDVLKQKYWFYNDPSFYNMGIEDMVDYFSNQGNNPNIYKVGDFMIHFAGKVLNSYQITKILNKIKDEVVIPKS